MSKTKTKPKAAKKPKPEMIKVEKKVVEDLASCVVWALKFLKTPSGAGMWTDLKAKPIVMMAWQEKFMLALDGVGYCIDRKEFWKMQNEKSKKRRR